jgi:hypothetical protein
MLDPSWLDLGKKFAFAPFEEPTSAQTVKLSE